MHETQKRKALRTTQKNEGLKGREGEGRLVYYKVDGDMPLGGSSSSNENEKDDKSKMMSGSKDLCGDSTRKRNDEKTNNNDVTFIVLQRNMRSMHSSERIEEMVCELEGYRWDALLLCETWRPDKAEIWETHHKHIIMGAGKYDNKHGIGILFNKSGN